jgi:N-acetylneuraminic acid mutarotase
LTSPPKSRIKRLAGRKREKTKMCVYRRKRKSDERAAFIDIKLFHTVGLRKKKKEKERTSPSSYRINKKSRKWNKGVELIQLRGTYCE